MAAGCVGLDDNGVETLGRCVNGGGEAGRSGADDHDVVQVLVGARVQTDAPSASCARREVEGSLVVVTRGPLANRAIGIHEDGKAKAVGNLCAERTHEGVMIEIDPSERDSVPTRKSRRSCTWR